MTDDMTELARRAVACEGWRWVPGMRAASDVSGNSGVIVYVYDGGLVFSWKDEYDDSGRYRAETGLCCLTSPTPPPLGLCRALSSFGGWLIMGCYAAPQSNASVIADGATKAEALVAALEVAS